MRCIVCVCRQDADDAVVELRRLLQQLQSDVDHLSEDSRQLSDDLTNQRLGVQVPTTPVLFIASAQLTSDRSNSVKREIADRCCPLVNHN